MSYRKRRLGHAIAAAIAKQSEQLVSTTDVHARALASLRAYVTGACTWSLRCLSVRGIVSIAVSGWQATVEAAPATLLRHPTAEHVEREVMHAWSLLSDDEHDALIGPWAEETYARMLASDAAEMAKRRAVQAPHVDALRKMDLVFFPAARSRAN